MGTGADPEDLPGEDGSDAAAVHEVLVGDGEIAVAAGQGIFQGEGDVVNGGHVRGSGDLCA